MRPSSVFCRLRRPLTQLVVIAFMLTVSLAPRLARAETWGQYLVVIDDSGSMNTSDPDRLVMLASLALAAGLSDADQLMIVGLNELAKGEVDGPRFVSPRELLADRDGSEGARTLPSAGLEHLARHQGSTPCKRALSEAAALLEAVAASGAPQTLLMLTDGACSTPLEPAATWLGGLRSHTEGRFRFALLSQTNAGERLDPTLVEYATRTGWTADPTIAFDARSLLQAFAEVLSFSRGLRYDGGGRVGLARSFAGASEVRVLAVSPEGRAPITLARSDASMDSREDPVTGGPTFKHGEYSWSLRVAKAGALTLGLPFAVRSPDAGVEVLVIPRYGELRVEAVVGPCTAEANTETNTPARPALPWTRERAVRSGQPACAWARLVGDEGETIDPQRSFNFEFELCEDESCTRASAMQPDADGTFNAQLGIMPEGRSERWFRARGGSLAAPVLTRRGIQAITFGITDVALADAPDDPITELDLGVFPQALPRLVTLEFSGSFPEGSEAQIRCEIAGDAGALDPLAGTEPCLRCAAPAIVAMQDPFTVQLEVQASNFCPLVSDNLPELPVALELIVEPKPDSSPEAAKIPARRVPLRALLRHAPATAQRVEVSGGGEAGDQLEFPRPVNGAATLELTAEHELPKGLEVSLDQTELRLTGEPGETATVDVTIRASDCCTAGEYLHTLQVSDPTGGPSLQIPVTIVVAKPSLWVCPGKTIFKGVLVALGLGFLVWLVRGFTSPQSFADTAVLARAESHASLSSLSEGDPDWRLVRSLESAKRGFYHHATVHFGGPKAALPSLRELPADARIEARDHGNASLIVEAEGIETFKESSGWTPISVGEQPIGSNIVLRRDDTYLMFRR